MSGSIRKVQVQARRRSFISEETGLPLFRGKVAPDESDWFPVSPRLFPEVEAYRFLTANVNDIIFEYRVVPASKKPSA